MRSGCVSLTPATRTSRPLAAAAAWVGAGAVCTVVAAGLVAAFRVFAFVAFTSAAGDRASSGRTDAAGRAALVGQRMTRVGGAAEFEPLRYGASARFDTSPSAPSWQAAAKVSRPPPT